MTILPATRGSPWELPHSGACGRRDGNGDEKPPATNLGTGRTGMVVKLSI